MSSLGLTSFSALAPEDPLSGPQNWLDKLADSVFKLSIKAIESITYKRSLEVWMYYFSVIKKSKPTAA